MLLRKCYICKKTMKQWDKMNKENYKDYNEAKDYLGSYIDELLKVLNSR